MKVVTGLTILAGGFLAWELFNRGKSSPGDMGGSGSAGSAPPPRNPSMPGQGDEGNTPSVPTTVNPPPPNPHPNKAPDAALTFFRMHGSQAGAATAAAPPHLPPALRQSIAKNSGYDPITGQRTRPLAKVTPNSGQATGNPPPSSPTGPGPGGPGGTQLGNDWP